MINIFCHDGIFILILTFALDQKICDCGFDNAKRIKIEYIFLVLFKILKTISADHQVIKSLIVKKSASYKGFTGGYMLCLEKMPGTPDIHRFE